MSEWVPDKVLAPVVTGFFHRASVAAEAL
jgi:hypothetical protein